jgi:membrane protease YdiL (CAAX protease family)
MRESLWTILVFIATTAVFKLLKKEILFKLSLILFFFFFSFCFLEIKYPYIKSLFWPIDLFVGTALFWGFTKLIKLQGERSNWNWKFDKRMLLSIPIILVPSLICLSVYFYFNQDVANKWPLPAMPMWAIPAVVLLIALINGLREELYFRFALQNYLSTQKNNVAPIICSAIVFGYLHYQGGFPQGGIGVFLTTCFGLLVGLQYYYFKSATLTWLTHSIVDAVMFTIILLSRS